MSQPGGTISTARGLSVSGPVVIDSPRVSVIITIDGPAGTGKSDRKSVV